MKCDPLYQKQFLIGELLPAALRKEPKEFTKFQIEQIRENIPKFQPHKITVNILHLNDKNLPDGEISSTVANLPESVIDSYQKNLLHDSFTPITFSQTGSALFSEAVRSMQEWEDQLIYKNHCTPYGHYWVIGVSYQFPHHKKTFLAFDYMRDKGASFCSNLEEEYVEYISYPFYLAWLHIYNAICSDTLKEWLVLSAGMTEARFKIIRGIAGQGLPKAKFLAEHLNINPRTIHRHVENSFEQLLSLQPERQVYEGNADRISSIMKAYRFMEYGASNVKRILPKRQYFDHYG